MLFAIPLAALAQTSDLPPKEVGHDAARRLVGNTLVYAKADRPDERRSVYFRLDGSAWATEPEAGDVGKTRAVRWATISDGRFCISDPRLSPWEGDCGTLTIVGDDARLQPRNGSAWLGKILNGDPRYLDPSSPTSSSVSGRAAIDALVGNTLVFVPYGGGREYLALYFLPGGRVRRAHNDVPDFDNWVIEADEKWSIGHKDERLCLSGGAWTQTLCVSVAVADDLVTLGRTNGGPLHGELRIGDARNLSPAAFIAAEKARAALAGHTLLFRSPDRGDERLFYFRRDGSGSGKRGDRAPGPIKWLLQPSGKLCLTGGRPAFRNDDCASLTIDGSRVTLTSPGRPEISATLVKGRAPGL